MNNLPYYQCPNDESHALRWGERVRGIEPKYWRMYCTLCPDTPAVFRCKLERSADPSGQQEGKR